MASFLDKFKIKTAVDKVTELDLSCQHVTTADWMQLSPVYIKEMVPGESISIKQSTFTRMAPMVVPTLGRGSIHNRAFFVPMRTIFPRWDEFITRTDGPVVASPTVNAAMVNEVPYTYNDIIVRTFLGQSTTTFSYADSDFVKTIASPVDDAKKAAADLCVKVWYNASPATSTDYYYNLTPRGRMMLKILQSLGYSIVWDYTSNLIDNTTHVAKPSTDCKYSLMPLFGFVKLFVDWYWPAQYVNTSSYNKLSSYCTYNGYSQSNNGWMLAYQLINDLFHELSVSGQRNVGVAVAYDSDYFVSAFDNFDGTSFQLPNTVNNITVDLGISESSNISSQQVQSGPGAYNTKAPVLVEDSGSSDVSHITQYGLNMLRALTDYVKRHQLVGARVLDRFYARFGISLDSDKLSRSQYIGSQNIPLQFGDVMSHTDTPSGTPLGGYAGKGLGYGEDTFEYKAEDYGFIIICNSFVPKIGYYQGLNRHVLHNSPLDFYTPEFDQLGNQAISAMELYTVGENDARSTSGEQRVDDMKVPALKSQIFGYTPRYSEYKVGFDRLTGDFRLNSKSTAGDTSNAWHLFRDVTGLGWDDPSFIVHTHDFVKGMDAKQYDRLFYNTTDEADKFYVIHDFNVISKSPMHSLYDTYEFESNGKSVIADVNGVKTN